MPNNITISPASGPGGAVVTTVDLSGFVSYPTTGELPASCLYVSADTSTAPTPVTDANPLPVGVQGTVAVSAAALPLPAGASTAAKQPALGTAGVASADVITVQGIATMTALKVDGSAATQPVSGTFWQTTQPVSGTFWQATQPVSAAALPLPAGAATAAKQPALGTAGSASADVITVQGAASMTALKVDGSATTQPVSGTFWQATQPVSGTFWQATQPVSGTVTANSTLQAGTALIGTAAVGLRTDAIYNGTTALTPKFAVFSGSSSGDQSFVALVATKKIRVLKWSLWAAGAVNVAFKSGGGAALSGTIVGSGAGPLGSGAFDPVGHFETAAGEALNLNLSAAVSVTGHVVYIEV